MPNPVYPPALPTPSAQQYSFDAPGGAMRTPLAGGRGRYALQYGRGTQLFDVVLVLKQFEFTIWNLFFLRRVGQGTRTFDMPLDSGHGLAPHASNIVPGSYGVQRSNGVGVVVTFQVEAQSQAFDMSQADVDAVLDLSAEVGPGLEALLARLARFVQVDCDALDF